MSQLIMYFSIGISPLLKKFLTFALKYSIDMGEKFIYAVKVCLLKINSD